MHVRFFNLDIAELNGRVALKHAGVSCLANDLCVDLNVQWNVDNQITFEMLRAGGKKAKNATTMTLEWMTPETKTAARDKLAKFDARIGYPDEWRDYSALEFFPDTYFSNAVAARAHDFDYNANNSPLSLADAIDAVRIGMHVDFRRGSNQGGLPQFDGDSNRHRCGDG